MFLQVMETGLLWVLIAVLVTASPPRLHTMGGSTGNHRNPWTSAGRPLNVAHRGSSGTLPENTAEAAFQAILDGADGIELDICITKDLRIVALHDSWLNSTTNVAEVFPEDRINTYYIVDRGREMTDYFSVDFTLEELKQLRVNQRYSYRDHNYDGQFQIATLEEVLDIINQSSSRVVIPYLEIKEADWVNSLDIVTEAGTTFEDLVLDVLASYGYTEASDPCIIHTINERSLRYISERSSLSLSLLMAATYNATDEVLEEISSYCYSIGAHRRLVVEANMQSGQITGRTDLVDRAQSFGLKVHAYTFRNEDQYLLWDYGQDPYAEYMDFLQLGVDGFLTDFPASLSRFLNATMYA